MAQRQKLNCVDIPFWFYDGKEVKGKGSTDRELDKEIDSFHRAYGIMDKTPPASLHRGYSDRTRTD
ncbi:MAG: hypothetical protein Q8P57_05300 [Candidatus Pacearchaeota archaeon]|nr:hypothetical protein [Candidatus Pacearchaeota archaeon]